MTPAEIAADVSARYGVSVSPSVVQICPPCTFTEATPVWDGRALVYHDADERKASYKRAMWAGAAKTQGRTVDMLARRVEVLRLHGEGMATQAMADALGVHSTTLWADLGALGLSSNRAVFITSAMKQSDLRAERIKQLHGEGWTAKRIAELMGIADDTVRELLWQKHRIRFVRKTAQPRLPPPSTRREISKGDERRARLQAFMADGTDPATWAALCGVHPDCIRVDLRKMGVARTIIKRVKIPHRNTDVRREDRSARVIERREKVREMTMQGMWPLAISRVLGCSNKTVQKDKLEMGLTGVRAA